MSDVGYRWSGDDWENYCRQLLSLRYGVDYQPVPDRDRGDFGIDGFTSGGELFQCYAAQDPRNLGDLHKKQSNKITTDLKKLEKNIEEVKTLTAPAMIKCWVLLVPRCDTKRTLLHGTAKADDVRARELDGVERGFYMRVLTDEDFSSEKQRLGVASARLLPDPPPDPTTSSVKEWKESSPEAVTTLNLKLANIPHIGSDEEKQLLCTELIKRRIHCAAAEEQLRSAQPQMWEHFNRARKQRERLLAVEHYAATPTEQHSLRDEAREIRSRLRSELLSLTEGEADDYAWGIVADWLIRCPLSPVSRRAA